MIERCVLAASLLALLASGCRKPASGDAAPPAIELASQGRDLLIVHGRVVQRAAPAPEGPPLEELERGYLANDDLDSRLEIMSQVADLATPEAVRVLAKLYASETDLFLKTELVSRLGSAEGEVETRLAVFAAALAPAAPEELRQTAIAELDTVEDRRAIPLWEKLASDADEGFRDRAADNLARLRLLELQK